MPVSCTNPPVVKHGTAQTSGVSFRNAMTILCQQGYTTDGSLGGEREVSVSCRADGTYTSPAACIPISQECRVVHVEIASAPIGEAYSVGIDLWWPPHWGKRVSPAHMFSCHYGNASATRATMDMATGKLSCSTDPHAAANHTNLTFGVFAPMEFGPDRCAGGPDFFVYYLQPRLISLDVSWAYTRQHELPAKGRRRCIRIDPRTPLPPISEELLVKFGSQLCRSVVRVHTLEVCCDHPLSSSDGLVPVRISLNGVHWGDEDSDELMFEYRSPPLTFDDLKYYIISAAAFALLVIFGSLFACKRCRSRPSLPAHWEAPRGSHQLKENCLKKLCTRNDPAQPQPTSWWAMLLAVKDGSICRPNARRPPFHEIVSRGRENARSAPDASVRQCAERLDRFELEPGNGKRLWERTQLWMGSDSGCDAACARQVLEDVKTIVRAEMPGNTGRIIEILDERRWILPSPNASTRSVGVLGGGGGGGCIEFLLIAFRSLGLWQTADSRLETREFATLGNLKF